MTAPGLYYQVVVEVLVEVVEDCFLVGLRDFLLNQEELHHLEDPDSLLLPAELEQHLFQMEEHHQDLDLHQELMDNQMHQLLHRVVPLLLDPEALLLVLLEVRE